MLEVTPFSTHNKRFREFAGDVRRENDDVRNESDAVVRNIIAGGALALLQAVKKYDFAATESDALRIPEAVINSAREQVSEQFLTAFSLARVNLRKFHEYQRRHGYMHDDGDGVKLSRLVRPVARIGVCCRTFGSLLACVVPAQVAGVGEIAVAVPPDANGDIDPKILAAAKVLGVNELYRISGAHAVAALALGTQPVKKVDKIVGDGGPLAEAAKQRLSRRVGIIPAQGVSELVVVADDSANARFIAADMLAQAGGEEDSGLLAFFTDDRLLAEAVRIEIARLADAEDESGWLRARVEAQAALFVCQSVGEALAAADSLAPARLVLATRDNDFHLGDVENAGAVFLGPWSSGAGGELFAGLNPLLPIAGSSRYNSGLGVDDFVREVSVLEYEPERLMKTGRHLLTLCRENGDPLRAEAIRQRLELLKLAVE